MGSTNAHGISNLDKAKQHAKSIYTDISNAYRAKNHREVTQLRVRVILFRDYIADGENAMMATDFYILPQQTHEYEKCINSIRAEGGGDTAEDCLEALAYAIKSKWTTHGDRKRQFIILWTDTPAHTLGFNSRSRYYPKGMPSDLGELSDWWEAMSPVSKRLALFTPENESWDYITDNWDNTICVPSSVSDSQFDEAYEKVISALV